MKYLALLLLFLLACQVKKHQSAESHDMQKEILQIARELYVEDFQLAYNRDSSAVFIYRELKPRPQAIFYTLQYTLIHIIDQYKTIEKGSVVNCSKFNWLDNRHLMIESVPGTINNPEGQKKEKKLLEVPTLDGS